MDPKPLPAELARNILALFFKIPIAYSKILTWVVLTQCAYIFNFRVMKAPTRYPFLLLFDVTNLVGVA